MPASLTSVINFHKCTSNEKTLLDLSHSTFDKGTQSIKVTPPIKVTLFHVTRGEGGFQVACICKKNLFGPQNLKTSFFVQKKLLHCDCHLLGGTVDNFFVTLRILSVKQRWKRLLQMVLYVFYFAKPHHAKSRSIYIIANSRNSCLPARINPVQLKNHKTFYIKFTQKKVCSDWHMISFTHCGS